MLVLAITYVASCCKRKVCLSNVKVSIQYRYKVYYYVQFLLCFFVLCFIVIVADCVDGDVRLQDGTYPSNGRVEICQHGIWQSVCSSHWDQNDAVVICRQLGYDSEGIIMHTIHTCSSSISLNIQI